MSGAGAAGAVVPDAAVGAAVVAAAGAAAGAAVVAAAGAAATDATPGAAASFGDAHAGRKPTAMERQTRRDKTMDQF